MMSCVSADLSNDVDAVFISKNDRLYRPPYARERNTTAYNNYVPYFICSVNCCLKQHALSLVLRLVFSKIFLEVLLGYGSALAHVLQQHGRHLFCAF